MSRLNAQDWDTLKAQINARGVRMVALDLPTSWVMANTDTDELTERMMAAMNDMLLDMLAAVVRKDYDHRHR